MVARGKRGNDHRGAASDGRAPRQGARPSPDVLELGRSEQAPQRRLWHPSGGVFRLRTSYDKLMECFEALDEAEAERLVRVFWGMLGVLNPNTEIEKPRNTRSTRKTGFDNRQQPRRIWCRPWSACSHSIWCISCISWFPLRRSGLRKIRAGSPRVLGAAVPFSPLAPVSLKKP